MRKGMDISARRIHGVKVKMVSGPIFVALVFMLFPACGLTNMHEHNRAIFERMANVMVGCSFVNSVRNNPYTERVSVKDGRADYISRSLKSACVIGFTIDEKSSTSTCAGRLPTEEAIQKHVQYGLGNGQPAWIGEVTGAIVSWRYISAPELCIAHFSGK